MEQETTLTERQVLIGLQPGDRRVLGVLMEKEQTTPEYYPMSLKAAVAACNQKTNREPVMNLTEIEVLNILRVLTQARLAERETGARVDRWRHRVDGILSYKPDAKALVTVLLLRGPQTPGELRMRTERMHPFQSLTQVEEVLRRLGEGEEPLVHELSRQPGQKETRWMLGEPGPSEIVARGEEAAEGDRPASLSARIEALESRLQQLESEVQALREDLQGRLDT